MQPIDPEEIRPPWSRSDRAIPRTIVRPLQEFLRSTTAGALPLFIAVVVALVWANSPWWHAYEALWRTPVAVGIGRWTIAEDVRFWIDEGLMTFFFLLAGLEIKRELRTGEPAASLQALWRTRRPRCGTPRRPRHSEQPTRALIAPRWLAVGPSSASLSPSL